MAVKEIVPIQFNPTQIQAHAKASQADTEERVFEFHCFTDDSPYSIPTGSIVVLKGSKPGGGSFSKQCTFSGNIVTIKCSSTMTDAAGEVECELMVTTSAGAVNSANFILDVEGTPINEEAVTPSDFSAFEEILREVTQKATDITSVVKYNDLVRYPNSQTTAKKQALDAMEGNVNVVGSLADIAKNLDGLTKGTGKLGFVTTDLNNVYSSQNTNTTVMFKYGTSAANRPMDYNEEGIGFSTKNANANYGNQIVFSNRDAYYRAYSGGAWYPWRVITPSDHPEIGSTYRYTSLDMYDKPGYYYLLNSWGVTDFPEGTNGNLWVFRTSSGLNDVGRFQVFHRMGTPGTNDGNIYIRQKNSAGWGPWWTFYSDEMSLGKRTKSLFPVIEIPTGSDLDTYKTPGEYYVLNNTIAANITNLPGAFKKAGRLVVERTLSPTSANVIQRYYQFDTGMQYHYARYSSNGSTWGRWYSQGGIWRSGSETTAIRVNSATWTKLLDIPILDGAGAYIFNMRCRFASNKTGYRALSYGNNAMSSSLTNTQVDIRPAIDGTYTYCEMTRALSIGDTVETLTLGGYQNSGAALDCIVYYWMVKIY